MIKSPMHNTDSTAPLSISNLTKKYGDFTAVNDVSFELKKGEIFGLLGPNGAGKTTLISIIVTLEKALKGNIKVFGVDTLEDPRVSRSLLGYVPQEVINHGYFNLEEILHFHSGYFGISKNKERIGFLIERLGLTPHKHKKVKHLSGGMKRRLMIAKALIHNPGVLLLDEPTAGVDIELRESLWSFVEELKAQGTSILLTTHYLEEAEKLCDRVGIIHHGNLLKVGDTKDLIKDFTFKKVHIETSGDLNHISKDNTNSFYSYTTDKNHIKLQSPSDQSIGDIFKKLNLNFDQIIDVKIEEGSLEEAFLRVLKES